MAQKVYKDASNRVILEMTVASGMPANSVTATSKTAVYAAATADNSGGPIADNTENGSINATVFQKLEIAPSDYGGNWATVFNGCLGATINGGTGWRLPTQRELMMMYVFKTALHDIFSTVGGTAFADARYWCATEFNATRPWYVMFNIGYVGNDYSKGTGYSARCVREVTD